ncbi:MAG: DUF1287 domain-containing protein [Lachnospiraceae bacterium]|nr:DUF1287 domain-containing protein [Lachnospiraceae bacterium]
MSFLIIAAIALTAACGAGVQESEKSTTIPGELPTILISTLPQIETPGETAESGAVATEDPVTTTVSEPYPTDTEYTGPYFDYTRMPGHYIKKGPDFGIETYHSPHDKNRNGIDDQTDILQGAKTYLDTHKPQYNASSYFAGGSPERNAKGVWEGVCTDVVGAALVAAGYDLKALVDADVANHPEWFTTELAEAGYGPESSFDIGDHKIDFRRVRVLYPFFEHRAEKLTTDLKDTAAWQPGDFVILFHPKKGLWEGHIAVISDRRADDGVPYVLHHAIEGQTLYEEDYLMSTSKVVVGHYRWMGFDGE